MGIKSYNPYTPSRRHMTGSDFSEITKSTPEKSLTVSLKKNAGLTPQSINKFGTYSVRAKNEAEAEKLSADAKALADAGCFAIVLEKVPAKLAAEVSASIAVPTIGIGAGNGTDGQILVVDDMLGKTQGFSPRFLRRYADLNNIMTSAIGRYVEDVKNSDFPNEQESY